MVNEEMESTMFDVRIRYREVVTMMFGLHITALIGT